ncbi:hypothetical protein D3C75_1369680 [compost metagenome]
MRVLQATAVLKTKMLLVDRRRNDQVALDAADQAAADDIGPGLRVMVVDGIEVFTRHARQVEQRHLGPVEPDHHT